MQYDILGKRLLEIGAKRIFEVFLKIKIKNVKITPLPSEILRIDRADAPFLIQTSDKKIVYLIELQSRWNNEKALALAEYYLAFKRKYKKPVKVIVFLFDARSNPNGFYKDESLAFKFKIVHIGRLQAKAYIHFKYPEILPFIALMKDSEKYIDEMAEIVYHSKKDKHEKADILSGIAVFYGFNNKKLSHELRNRWRNFMIESPVLDEIKAEVYIPADLTSHSGFILPLFRFIFLSIGFRGQW